MKKYGLFIAISCVLLLCGCVEQTSTTDESAYQTGYDTGYEDGYEDGYKEGCDEHNDEKINLILGDIVNLIYDHEYEKVEMLLNYCPAAVEYVLEEEFGETDWSAVKEYLNKLSQTVTGKCEMCGKDVYADDVAILPDGIECAHSKCIVGDTESGTVRINK